MAGRKKDNLTLYASTAFHARILELEVNTDDQSNPAQTWFVKAVKTSAEGTADGKWQKYKLDRDQVLYLYGQIPGYIEQFTKGLEGAEREVQTKLRGLIKTSNRIRNDLTAWLEGHGGVPESDIDVDYSEDLVARVDRYLSGEPEPEPEPDEAEAEPVPA